MTIPIPKLPANRKALQAEKNVKSEKQSYARHQNKIQTLSQSVRNFIYLLIICSSVIHTATHTRPETHILYLPTQPQTIFTRI